MDENKMMTIEEASKGAAELMSLCKACYDKGGQDALRGVCVGTAMGLMASSVLIGLFIAIDKHLSKAETEN